MPIAKNGKTEVDLPIREEMTTGNRRHKSGITAHRNRHETIEDLSKETIDHLQAPEKTNHLRHPGIINHLRLLRNHKP